MSFRHSEQAAHPDPGGPGKLSSRYPLLDMVRHLSDILGEFCALSLRQVPRNSGPTMALLIYAPCIGCSLGQLTLACPSLQITHDGLFLCLAFPIVGLVCGCVVLDEAKSP